MTMAMTMTVVKEEKEKGGACLKGKNESKEKRERESDIRRYERDANSAVGFYGSGLHNHCIDLKQHIY